ncbi:MAG: type III pantothenate kinase [Eubacteriales bacterium]
MLLIIDIGNTNIVFGVYNEDKLVKTFRLETKKYTVNEIGLSISQYFNLYKINMEDITAVVIASVVPHLIKTLNTAFNKYFFKESYTIDNQKINITNLYEYPSETGVDRLINAVAAIKKYSAPCIIVDMGTATTIDAVNLNGEFMGGVIFPGAHILSEILSIKTSLLPEIEIYKPINIIGKNTKECIRSGIYYGYIGAVEGILYKMMQSFSENIKVIATGGLAKSILEGNKNIDYIDDTLTLEGIKFIYESQA